MYKCCLGGKQFNLLNMMHVIVVIVISYIAFCPAISDQKVKEITEVILTLTINKVCSKCKCVTYQRFLRGKRSPLWGRRLMAG